MADLPEPEGAPFVPLVALVTSEEPNVAPSFVEVAGSVIAFPFTISGSGDASVVSGAEAVITEIKQVLGIEAASEGTLGELEWDPARGSLIHRIRHLPDNVATRQLARTMIANTLQQYVNGAEITEISIRSIDRVGTQDINQSLTGRLLLLRVSFIVTGTTAVETLEAEI